MHGTTTEPPEKILAPESRPSPDTIEEKAPEKKQTPKEKAIIALDCLRLTFGGHLPHPEAPIADIDRIADEDMRRLLRDIARKNGYQAMGELMEMLGTIARRP